MVGAGRAGYARDCEPKEISMGLSIDDFTTGRYEVTIPAGPPPENLMQTPANAVQSGSMLGKERLINLGPYAPPKSPRGEPIHSSIGNANRLNFSLGAECTAVLQVWYGLNQKGSVSLGADLSKYTAIRVNFDSSTAVNVDSTIEIGTPEASSGSAWIQGANIPAGVFTGVWTPFFVEFPLYASTSVNPPGSVGSSADYQFTSAKYGSRPAVPADLVNVTYILFQFQVYGGSISLNQFELV